MIPALFLGLIIITQIVTLQSLETAKTQTSMLALLAQQRILRSTYLNEVMAARQGIPNEHQALLQNLKNYQMVLLHGGEIDSILEGHRVTIPSVQSKSLREALEVRVALLNQLEHSANRFLNSKRKSPEAREALRSLIMLSRKMNGVGNEALHHYLEQTNHKINQTVFLGLIIVLLAGSMGVFLAFQQKRADHTLIDNEHRFRQVFEFSPLGKVLLNLNGQPQRFNATFCRLLGYSQEDLLKLDFYQLIHPDDRAEEHSLVDQLNSGQNQTYQCEQRYFHKDGHVIWASVHAALIQDIWGKPAFVTLQLQDITAQRQVMGELQRSEARYRNMVEFATDGIIIAGMNGLIQTANNHAHQIFGYPSKEMNGLPLINLIPPVYREAHLTGMQHLILTHQPRLTGRVLELQGLKKDGFTFPLEMSLSVWTDSAGEMYATAILRDISERKLLQRERELLLQSNKNLEEFTLIATHDLQEPLRKIAFYAERFSNRESERLQEDSLRDIQRLLTSVNRLQNLISDLLSYSRVSPQNTRYCFVNLEQVIENVLFDLSPEIVSSNATITKFNLPVIEADQQQMRTLFYHLIQNALKYRRHDLSPEIRIYGNLLGKENRIGQVPTFEIRVQDNGIGFDPKYLTRIFKVFQRLHSQTEFSGTGIGLATCRKILDQHSGMITATSIPNEGSTFIIQIPVKQP